MKKISICFSALILCLSGLGVLLSFPSSDISADPVVNLSNFEVNPAITVLDEVKDVVFGEPNQKPRFTVNGVEMIEGVDFEYVYGVMDKQVVYFDYRDELKADCFYSICARFYDLSTISSLHPHESYDDIEELTYFYAYPVDMSKCTYDCDAEVPYDGSYYYRPTLRAVYINDYEIPLYKLNHNNVINGSDALNKYLRVTAAPAHTAFTGTLDIPFKIKPKEITQYNLVADFPDREYFYTGGPVKYSLASVGINVDGIDLYPRDYKVEYENNINVGTARMKIIGQNFFCGEYVKEYQIHPRDLSSKYFSAYCKELYYTGKDLEPDVVCSYNDKQLTQGVDYDLTFGNIKDKGEYKITITGKDNFTGTKDINVIVDKTHIDSCSVSDVSFLLGTNKSIEELIRPAVTFEGRTLVEGVDYSLDLSGCTASYGRHTYVINGTGEFTGSREVEYYGRVDASGCSVLCDEQHYTGDPIEPVISLGYNGSVIAVTPDRFEVTFRNNINAGKAEVTLRGIAAYYIDKTLTFDILPASINDCTITYDKTVHYDGKVPAVPGVSVRFNGKELKEGKDFKVECTGNTTAGKGTLKVTGINNFSGSVKYDIKVTADISATVTVKPSVTDKPVVTAKPSVTDMPAATGKPVVSTKPEVTSVPSVTTKPVVTTKPGVTAKPSKSAEITATVVPPEDPKADILSFVERIYTYVLEREPDNDGASFWTDELYSFRRTGAEVGLGFIFSDEFTSRGLNDEEFVTVLYNTFFGREPEAEGLSFWTSALADGSLDRMGVANGFVYSQEWADTCAAYGIRSGGEVAPSIEITPSDATLSFVERMYTTAMNRASDEEGKKFWANELSNFRFTGEQVGVMFFLSEEMQGFNLSNEEFVSRLYKTFMDREPEEGGFNFWVGYLDDGGSREGAVLGFTRSEEFVNKCIEARILPY